MVTFCFTDIEGSTRLFQRLGDAYAPALEIHNRLLRDAFSARGGVEVRSLGDSFFFAFADPAGAVSACAGAQVALRRHQWEPGAEFLVRMGLHTGWAQPFGDDYVAMPVHQAARVAAVAHGGQVVVSASTVLALGAPPAGINFNDLGEYRLKDFDAPERLFQLLHPDLPVTFPALRTPSAAVHNLPRTRTSFVGRASELTTLKELLKLHPLVTLVGGGGFGKTRLALETATELTVDHPEGVWLVELASIADPDAIVAQVAGALSVKETPGRDVLTLIAERIGEHKVLVVVDNCEHVIERAATVVDALLERCPALAVIATSREPLRVAGEQVFRIDPLGLPSIEVTPEALLEFDAARLFVARATSAAIDFELTAAKAAAVASICRQLDGIPLAIELAAAATSSYSPAEIDRVLTDRFGALTSGLRTAPRRHQTLEATIAWSHELLQPNERLLFARLAVFAGGWTLDAATAICGADPLGSNRVSSLHQQLVDKSLIQRDFTDDEVRYRMLQTVRAYAQLRLAETGEEASVRKAHAAHFTEWMHLALPGITSPQAATWLAAVDAEIENVRLALRSALDEQDDETALALFSDVNNFLRMRSRFSEGATLSDLVLGATAPAASRARLYALSSAGGLAAAVTDLPRARKFLAEAEAMARQLDDRSALAVVLNNLSSVAASEGDLARTAGYLNESLQLFEELGDTKRLGVLALNLGGLEFRRGNSEAARAHLMRAVEVLRDGGDANMLAAGLLNLGLVSHALGNLSEARIHDEEAIQLFRALGNKSIVATALLNLGEVAYDEGKRDEAIRCFDEALAVSRELGDLRVSASAMGALANAAVDGGDKAGGLAQYEEVLRIGREIGDISLVSRTLTNMGDVAAVAGDGDKARAYDEEALNLARSGGEAQLIVRSLARLAFLDHVAGKDPAAHLAEALALAANYPLPKLVIDTVAVVAHVASGRGDFAGACRLLGSVASLGDPGLYLQSPTAEFKIKLRKELGDDRYTAAWAAGETLSVAEAIEAARALVVTENATK